jgi:hypothetical protein
VGPLFAVPAVHFCHHHFALCRTIAIQPRYHLRADGPVFVGDIVGCGRTLPYDNIGTPCAELNNVRTMRIAVYLLYDARVCANRDNNLFRCSPSAVGGIPSAYDTAGGWYFMCQWLCMYSDRTTNALRLLIADLVRDDGVAVGGRRLRFGDRIFPGVGGEP